jgi:hypothetical protein
MRYAQGGGLTAEGRRRREQVRLEAARRFEQKAPTAVIAAELRVSERSVRRWRQAWLAGGEAGLASRGPAAQCRLGDQQLAALDGALAAGPLAAGWQDQRWTLGRGPGPGGGEVQGALHHPGDLVPGPPPRLELPAGRAPRDRAGRRRGGGVEEGDLAADKSTAAALGGWIVFEDECGQSLRPPWSRTWGRRGITPVIRVRGGGTGRVSVAGLACYRPGDRSRLIYRLHCYRGRKGETKAFTWTEYRDLLIAAHRQLPGGVVVLVWDNLNVHRRAELRPSPRPRPGCGCSGCPHTRRTSIRWRGSGRCSSAACWPTSPSPALATWSGSSGTA